MRVLVTGGAGFVGSHLAEALLAAGDEVLVLDDLSTGSLDNVEHLMEHHRFHLTVDSVMNEPVTAKLVARVDAIVHLAAAVGVKLIVEQPVRTIETNVGGAEAVLRHARRHGTRVLLASTSEVYGKNAALPFREDADLVLGPTTMHRWAYACSKALDEFLALAYWKEHQLPVVIARLFNTVGPRQTGAHGMVVPRFIAQALAGDPLTVYGDGSQSRSFTWVGDAVTALVALLHEPRAVGQVLNVGNEQETTILALAERVRALTGSRSTIVTIPFEQAYEQGFEDMPRRVPDLTKVRALIGFEPRVQLDEILERAIVDARARAAASSERRAVAAG